MTDLFKRINWVIPFLPILCFIVGCEETTDPGRIPIVIDPGSANFSRYVALGNSLTAGLQSAALSERDQPYSYANLLAKQVQTAFEMPLIRNPGIGGRIRLVSLTPTPTLTTEPSVSPLDPASNLNAALARPYNNLGIPGAILYDMMDTTGASTNFISKSLSRGNPFFALILRSSLLGNSIYAQAKAQQPTFITLWVGNNDALGYATSGGMSGSNVLPPARTTPLEPAFFEMWYRQLIDSLKTTGADIVTANIPDVTVIPFLTTLGAQIRPRIPVGVALRYQRHGNTGAAFDTTTLTGASTDPYLTLTGSSYAPLLGQPGGKWYRDRNISPLPPGIDTTQPFGFHPQNPWPDPLTLDSDEKTIAQNAVLAYNAIIDSIASNRNIAVVDVYGFFNSIVASGPLGIYIPELGSFTPSFIRGGLFSYDGVHPSSRGQAILANEWIKVINAKFGAKIPLVSVSSVPGIPIGKITPTESTLPDYSSVQWESFVRLMAGFPR